MVNPAPKLQMKLSESKYLFSRRMLSFFKMAEVSSVADLTTIPLQKITCFRGFKTKCREELISFIEYEGLGSYFKEFERWKNEM